MSVRIPFTLDGHEPLLVSHLVVDGTLHRCSAGRVSNVSIVILSVVPVDEIQHQTERCVMENYLGFLSLQRESGSFRLVCLLTIPGPGSDRYLPRPAPDEPSTYLIPSCWLGAPRATPPQCEN